MAETAHVEVWRFDSIHLVKITGVLDFAASVRLRLVLFEQLDAGADQVVVDLAGVRLIDASAVGVMLRVQEQLQERGGSLRVQGAQGLALEVLEITGSAKALAAYDPPLELPSSAERTDNVEHLGTDRHQWQGLWGDEINTLLWTISQLPADDPHRRHLRQRVVEACLPYAERLARRFHGLGESAADLNQVAAVGLLKAVDRFDPSHTTDFASYATPTIVGELKRHFRDRGWSVRVPRRLQELRLEINQARESLTQRLGRSPTVRDVADHLEIDEEPVVEAMVAASGYRASSLYAPTHPGEDAMTPADWLGQEDDGLDAVEFREALHPLLAKLPHREQKILSLRFYGNMTQAEIARDLGISQMHVSRLLSRTLDRLREDLLRQD
jgi:RNA polymerase sigma-B factor